MMETVLIVTNLVVMVVAICAGIVILKTNEQAAKERADLIDRLMARDLSDLKLSQRIASSAPGKIVSKNDNTKRVIEDAARKSL